MEKEEFENDVTIQFTKSEYNYVSDLCNTMYDNLKKLPKKFRTPKFYLLENMIKNYFNK